MYRMVEREAQLWEGLRTWCIKAGASGPLLGQFHSSSIPRAELLKD